MTRALALLALAGAIACAMLAARGAPVEWVVASAFAMSVPGSIAIVRALAVEVGRGEIVVLVGGRHRGPDRVWRGWRFVRGGRTLKLPGEEVVRVAVTADSREPVIAAIDAALFRENPRGRAEPLIREVTDGLHGG